MNDLEVAGKRAFFHPHGTMGFEQGAEMVARAMKQARASGADDLVVNLLDLTGYEPLRIFERYEMATRWVESAGASMRVAWVMRPELIDPQKIGIVIAQNRGASGDVFATEAQALTWLDARRVPAGRSPHSSGGNPDST